MVNVFGRVQTTPCLTLARNCFQIKLISLMFVFRMDIAARMILLQRLQQVGYIGWR